MSPRDFSHVDGPIARASEVLGDQWTLLILRDAFYGVKSPNDFCNDLGIAKTTLVSRLRLLCAQGVLSTDSRAENPEYELTEKGQALFGVLTSMMEWANTWATSESTRRDILHRCGQDPVRALTACSHCGEELTPDEVRIDPLPESIVHRTMTQLEMWRSDIATA